MKKITTFLCLLLFLGCADKAPAPSPKKDSVVQAVPVQQTANQQPLATKPPPPPPKPWKLDLDKIKSDVVKAIDDVKLEKDLDQVWGKVIYVEHPSDNPKFHDIDYKATVKVNDWYPASSIKLYAVVAALEKLKKHEFGFGSEATFYTCLDDSDPCTEWDEENVHTYKISFLIKRTVTCSSNLTYSLLLRFVGIDEMNQSFLTKANGFRSTAISMGYAKNSKFEYHTDRVQRIDLKYGKHNPKEHTFIHKWSGESYSQEKSCQHHLSEDEKRGNCTSADDITEFMKRLVFHNQLPEKKRFDIRDKNRKWLLDTAMNNLDVIPKGEKTPCGGPGWEGVKQIMPDAYFRHKGGSVSDWRCDIQYVCAPDREYCYIALFAFAKKQKKAQEETMSFAREIARAIHSAHQK
jgi:hypothetical protein